MRPMKPLSPIAWYGLLVLRLVTGLGLAWLCVVYVWNRDWPTWVKVAVDILIVNGIILGAFVTGPVTYRGYAIEAERLADARRRVKATSSNARGA